LLKAATIFDLFLTPNFAPFAISFFLMIGVGLIEATGFGLGHFDIDAEVDAPDASALGWLGMGHGMPILIWFTSFLGCFTLAGLAIQQLAAGLSGGAFSWPIAALAALGVGGVANRFVASQLARLIPAYETTIISSEDLIMRRGTILEGSARRGHPARAKVIDQHKQAHYIMVEPHNDDEVIVEGEVALLVRKEGPIFFGLPDAHPTLRPL
jgi:hypothetical protein